MLHGSLALFTQSLRVDSRLVRTHLFRVLFVGIIFFLLGISQLTSMIGMVGAPGLTFFKQITWLNFWFITASAVSYFSTAITEEKDESTLGLLRMAGIDPVSLLFGKSTTRLFTAATILIVQLPFTLLAITLGGVTTQQILAAYMALLAYMIFVANLGLFCSVYASSSARASGMMTLLLALYFFGVGMGYSLITVGVSSGTLSSSYPFVDHAAVVFDWLHATSIFTRISVIMTTGFAEPVFLTEQVTASLAAALGIFLVSWALFEPLTRERRVGVTVREMFRFSGRPEATRKPCRSWRNPLMWKDYYFVTGGTRMMFAKLILYGAIVAAIGYYFFYFEMYRSALRKEFAVTVLAISIGAAMVELSLYASSIFRDEVRQRALPLLIMLPKSTAKITYSKAAGTLLALFPAVACFILGCALMPDLTLRAFLEIATDIGMWAGVSFFVLFLHITAYISLVVKWGALPLSLFLLVTISYCFVSPIYMILFLIGKALGNEQFAFIPWVFLNGGLCFVLQTIIRQRLEAMATE